MGLIEFIILVAVVGFIVYLIATYVPMPAPFKTVIYGVAALVIIVFLLKTLGIGDLAIDL